MAMINAICLLLLQLISIASCLYGIYTLASIEPFSVFSILLYGVWFILGASSNVCGVLSSYYGFLSPDDDEIESEDNKSSASENCQFYVQYHYLLAWLTVVLGYPSIVAQAWMAHYTNQLAHLHFILPIPPLIAWIRRQPAEIVFATQITGFAAVFSHLYIEYLANDTFGMIGSSLMILNLLAIAVPTRYNIAGFSAREFYLLSLAITSYIFSRNIETSAVNPLRVTDLTPWIKSG